MSKMRILLDCRFQKGAGPNVATRYLVEQLVKLNKNHQFIILQHKGQQLPDYDDVRKIYVPSRNPIFEFSWVQIFLPTLLRRLQIDVCHSFKHVGPLFAGVPTILNLMEVGHFLPDGQAAFQLDLPHKAYWNYVLPLGLRRASHIAAISQYCESVIEEELGIPPTKVSVVHLAADSSFRVVSDFEQARACRSRYGLPDSYILCVGNFYPHKNYDNIVRMHGKLKKVMRNAPKLVMVGDYSYAGAEFFELINHLDLKKDVILLDYVDNKELVYIYNLADLLLFPPHLAGFGIPCVEAMACGIPIVASDRGAIAEVTDGAAILLQHPSDIDEMLQAVRRVLCDDDLRKEMRKKGLVQARQFSWEKSAAKLLQLYESVGNQAA